MPRRYIIKTRPVITLQVHTEVESLIVSYCKWVKNPITKRRTYFVDYGTRLEYTTTVEIFVGPFSVWKGTMGNKYAKQPSAFAHLLSERSGLDARTWKAFSKRMSKVDAIWPPAGATSTRMLRGLTERQVGRHGQKDEAMLKHVALVVQDRETKTDVHTARLIARCSARPTTTSKKVNPIALDTSDTSDTDVVYLAQGTGAPAARAPPAAPAAVEGAEGDVGTTLSDQAIEAEVLTLRSHLKDIDHLEQHLRQRISRGRGSPEDSQQLSQVQNQARDARQRVKELNLIISRRHEAAYTQAPVRIIPIGEGNAVRQMHRTFTPPEIAALKQVIPDLPKDIHRFDDWLNQTVATYNCNEQDMEQLAIGVVPWALSQAARNDALWAAADTAQRIIILSAKAKELYPVVKDWAQITEAKPQDNESPLEFLARFRPIFHLHSGIPEASSAIPLATHFLAAWPTKVVDKLKSHTLDWQHKNVSELCTLLAHFKRVIADKESHARASRRQAPVHTVPTAPPVPPPPVYYTDLSCDQHPNTQHGPPPQAPRRPPHVVSGDHRRDICFGCGQTGHWRNQCPAGRRGPRGRGRPARGRPT